MTRVFLEEGQLRGDSALVLGPDAHHLLHVLRLGVGDRFTIVGEDGREHEATISEVATDRVLASVGAALARDTEPHLHLTIYHGLPRLPRYETALRMCTELGVAAFVPVLTRRSVVKLSGQDRPGKAERWRRIVESAARQCGRTRIPEVIEPVDFADALGRFAASGVPGAIPAAALAGTQALSLGEWVAGLSQSDVPDRLAVFIGSESGFDLAEEEQATQAGIAPVTMGPRILRTETAAVVAAAICLERSRQLR